MIISIDYYHGIHQHIWYGGALRRFTLETLRNTLATHTPNVKTQIIGVKTTDSEQTFRNVSPRN